MLCISQFQQCPSSPGNRGAFAHVVNPGGGTFAILSQPGDWALATPGHLTHVFSGKDEVFVEQCLVHQGLEKLVDVFKGMFMVNYGYFFIYLKYLMLKTKYIGINIIKSN